MAQDVVVRTLLEQIAKHWGWEVGDKVRAEIQSVINAHNIDLEQLQSAIQTIQGLLDADPDTPEFDVGQNIISQLTDHLARITNLENEVATLKADENTPGSVAYAVKQERDRAQAAEANLQGQINANTADLNTLKADENTEGSVRNIAKSYVDAEAAARQAADQALQAQIDEIVGGSDGTSLSGLKTEIDNIEAGVGLNEDGTYTPNTATNYIDEATSVVDATEKLDAKLKEVEDRVTAGESQAQQAYAQLDGRVSTLETDMATLKGDENTEGSVAKAVKDGVTEAKTYAEQVAQAKANEAKEQAVTQAKSEVFDAIAAISATTLAGIFRQALDCGFAGKPKEDVLNGTGDCATAGGSAGSGDNGDGGDGAVI
jgi:hypothetical protein